MENTLQKIPLKQELELQQQNLQKNENCDFTCEICIEPMANGGRKFQNGNKCCHAFCVDCMNKYIHVQVNENNVAEIPCPALNCDETLDPVACGPVVGPSLFVRWCDVLCESAISGLEKWYCPDKNCNVLIVNECAAGRSVAEEGECPNCRKLFCLKCKGVWHGRRRCGDGTRGVNDVVLRDLVKRERWKRCPQCGHIIQFMGGCPIVKCRCGFRFCYNCEEQASMCRCIVPSVHIYCNVLAIIFLTCIIFAPLIYFLVLIR